MQNTGHSPEFALMLACLRWPLDQPGLEMIAECCQSVTDWQHVLDIVARHRVLGLVWKALQTARCNLPVEVSMRFQRASAAAARHAMFLSAESLRLAKLLDQSSLPVTFLKGAVVAMLAYRDVTVRHAKDIDLLVPDTRVLEALGILRNAGYMPLFDLDAIPPSRRVLWFRYAKSMDLQHTETGVLLELHWQLTDLSLREAFPATRQSIALAPGRALSALNPDELLTYLCIHGATHGWMRLKWLADVHALLRQRGDLERVYRRLRELGGGRAAGQALLLCHDLLGLPLPRNLLHTLQGELVLKILRRMPVQLYRRGNEVAEVDALRFGTTTVYVSRMLLGNSLGAFLQELRTWAFRPDELLRSRLPRSLIFLFPFLRVGAWAKARLRHGGRSTPE